MNEQGADREEVFVVRFWPERARPGANAWRGCVDFIPTGQRHFFVEISALADFVTACLDDASQRRAGGTPKGEPTS